MCTPRRFFNPSLRASAVLFFFALSAVAQTVIPADLLGRLDSRRIAAGSPLFVRVVAEWKQDHCRLHAGETLEARVANVSPQGKKAARVALRFLPVTCAADPSRQIVPVLVAIRNGKLLDSSQFDQASLLEALSTAAVGSTAFGGGALGSRGEGFRANTPNTPPQAFAIRIGQVEGLHRISLALPASVLDPTAIESPHAFLLDPGVQFFLDMRTLAVQTAAVEAVNTVVPVSAVDLRDAIAATPRASAEIPDLCADSGCVLAEMPVLHTGGQLEHELSIAALGYRPRSHRILLGLDDDATVHFLAEDTLLVTFAVHPLIQRSATERDGSTTPRIVRALVVSARDGRVLHTADWRIDQEGRYLWPLPGGRMLAAVGNSLILFDGELRAMARWPFPGALALVRVSSTGTLIAVASLTPQDSRLVAFMGPVAARATGDYQLSLLDGGLNLLGQHLVHGYPVIAAILNTGILAADPQSEGRWNIHELLWNGSSHRIAEVRSGCPVRTQALDAGLVLAAGCTPDAAARWYKVFRGNGRTLLRGASSLADWPVGVSTSLQPAQDIFALGLLTAARPIDFDTGVDAGDFRTLQVSIYSSRDGRRLFDTGPLPATAARQSFALSPSGTELSILGTGGVAIYRTGISPTPSPR